MKLTPKAENVKMSTDARTKVERLHKDYSRLMYSAAFRILKDAHLAEDAVQQSFLRVFDHLHKVDEENVPATRSFLVIICKNISYNLLKKKQHLNKNREEVEDAANIPDPNISPVDIVINNELYEKMIDAIQALPPIYREPILFKYINHATTDEIAKIFDLQPSTVRKRLERGREMLIKVLVKEVRNNESK